MKSQEVGKFTMSMMGFNNSGMGLGDNGMLGGVPSNGRFSIDELQQQQQHSAASGGTVTTAGGGMNQVSVVNSNNGMGSAVAVGMSNYPGAGGGGGMGAVGGGVVSGYHPSQGSALVSNSNLLSASQQQHGHRDDELLISLLWERNQQLQGMSAGGVVPGGVVPSMYLGTSSTGSTMPCGGGSPAGFLSNFNLTHPAPSVPYDVYHHRDSQGAGLACSPYLMDARTQDAMLRDLQNPNAAANILYEQQRRGLSATSGLGSAFASFDNTGHEQAALQSQQQQQNLEHQQLQRDDDEDMDPRGSGSTGLQQQKEGDERTVNTNDGGATLHEKPHPPLSVNNRPRVIKKRQSKDAARRPLSAYNLFFSDERERILQEREEANAASEAIDGSGNAKTFRKIQVQELAKIIGERWRALQDEWRIYYQGLADEDMKRHKEEKKRTPKDPSVPKRPPTSFLLFSNKRRKALKRQFPDASNADLSKMLSKTWREAPPLIRQKYVDEATDLSKIYKADMVTWRKKSCGRKKDFVPSLKASKKSDDDDFSGIADTSFSLGMKSDFLPFGVSTHFGDDADDTGSGKLTSRPSTKSPSKKRVAKDPSAPKRPLSAFLAFSNTRRKPLKQQHPEATNADLSKMLSKMWREAVNEFRQKYIDDAAELSEAYKLEMAEWKANAAGSKGIIAAQP